MTTARPDTRITGPDNRPATELSFAGGTITVRRAADPTRVILVTTFPGDATRVTLCTDQLEAVTLAGAAYRKLTPGQLSQIAYAATIDARMPEGQRAAAVAAAARAYADSGNPETGAES